MKYLPIILVLGGGFGFFTGLYSQEVEYMGVGLFLMAVGFVTSRWYGEARPPQA
jgi:hypothetical protein